MSSKRIAQEFVTNLKVNLRNIMSHKNSKATAVPPQIDNSHTSPESYTGVEHAPSLQPLEKAKSRIDDVVTLSIPVDDQPPGGKVPGFLHLPQNYTSSPKDRVATAAILLSGAGGGVVGPSSIYLSLGDKLASLRKGVPVLRLDYRFPARNRPCCQDVISAMKFLETDYQISKFVLVGWSFGSAPVFTVAASELSVVGCATIAGQTAETSGVRLLTPRPVLLLHGTGDMVLSHHCSENLYDAYGSTGSRKLHLFEADNHALTKNALLAEEMLCDFVAQCADVPVGDREQKSVIKQQLIGETRRVELMRAGGDLRGDESVN